MAESEQKVSRRQQILEALAAELEKSPGARITTAGLAKAVGVSEAALYRHFPSKARMFEALIEFSEESIFGRINRILEDDSQMKSRIGKIMTLLLGFSAKNPGITRILLGDALVGETERLRVRIDQFFDRLETQLKQVLREGAMKGELASEQQINAMARLLLAIVEGHLQQYVRSDFQHNPIELWESQWPLLEGRLLG
jgi:TetR/AcrR family transcriptional regulator